VPAAGSIVSARSRSTRVDDKVRRSRRFFTVKDKLRIIEAFKACASGIERGKLVRAEGLYYSQITDWVEAFDKGGADALVTASSGRPKVLRPSPDTSQLLQQLAHYKARAEQAEALVDIQKKVLLLLDLLSPKRNESP
jgi:transposase-like protein